VTTDDMVHHVGAVARSRPRALVVGDLPWLSYHVSRDETVHNAAKLVRAGAGAVKLEGGRKRLGSVAAILDAEIPVMGHIGLTPQSVHQMGYKVQGKTVQVATQLLADAAALDEAGAFSVVLEGVPAALGARITSSVSIPTIGIGAGPHCDGQVQVIHDILGLFTDFVPKHAKRYAALGLLIQGAARQYAAEVVSGEFPTAKESFAMDDRVLHELDAGEPGFLESAPRVGEPEFSGYAPQPS
jgi:3-methyl-2-oxobutanoate hydroxymethyltransferase